MKYLFILVAFLLIFCNRENRDEKVFKVGVVVNELGVHHYKIASTGKASEQSIDEEDEFKKKFTSCQAAKEMYLRKIRFLEPNQIYRDYFIEQISNRHSDDGVFCEIIVEYKIPKEERKR